MLILPPPEGVDANDWTNTYGITTDGEGLSLKFVTAGKFNVMLSTVIIVTFSAW